MEKRLIELFKDFQLVDLLGFANILGVQEEDDFVEFLTNIVEAFSKKNRKGKRQLLKLAKQVAAENAAALKNQSKNNNNSTLSSQGKIEVVNNGG